MNLKIKPVERNQFDKKFYRRAYPDVRKYHGELYIHYLSIGAAQNRLPSKCAFYQLYPLFDLQVYSDVNHIKFNRREEYYSHFHHFGYNGNNYYCYQNKMFINKSRSNLVNIHVQYNKYLLSDFTIKHRHHRHHHGHRRHHHRRTARSILLAPTPLPDEEEIEPCARSPTPILKDEPIALVPLESGTKQIDISLLPSITRGATNYRDFVSFKNSAGENVVLQQLALSANEGIEFTAKMPINWQNNSTVHPNLHWTPVTSMYGTTETFMLSLMIKSQGDSFDNNTNTYAKSIKIGTSNGKMHNKTAFPAFDTKDLSGSDHVLIGKLNRLTNTSSYSDDIFIIGLDLKIMIN